MESVDIFPTLCDLSGVELPNFGDGVSLIPMLKNPKDIGHSAFSYNEKASAIRTQNYRFILHKNGATELYDHTSKEKESKNVAEVYPQIVAELKQLLIEKLEKKNK